MRNQKVVSLALVVLILTLLGCAKPAAKDGKGAKAIPKGSAFRILIVMDTIDDWSSGVRDGFIQRLDAILATSGSKASYEVLDTKLDPAEAASIKDRIEKEKPGLVCEINYPSGFADSQIALKLKGAEYRFVSENAVPVETGVVSSWAKPGGNVCGAGVFVQLNSTLKLIRKVDPSITRIFSYSWDAMKDINAWWEKELRRACAEEGFILEEFKAIRSHQEEMSFLKRFSSTSGDTAVMGCISAYVNDDGSPVNPVPTILKYIQESMKTPFLTYEDSSVQQGALLGACVIWKDLGAQLADLGGRVLSGEDPGSIPWEYPRKHNIVINKMTADRLGIPIPQEVVNAAYRIYTDYQGGFMGKSD
jgi:putative tryptophan/tyrosine transport system substrate-binding protein